MSDIEYLQNSLAVPKTGSYDVATQQAVVSAQQKLGLPPNGEPDPATLAQLLVYDPMDSAPKPFKQGKKMGTLGRDFVTALNQVPAWAYLVVGLGFGGLAYYVYRKRNPKAAGGKSQ